MNEELLKDYEVLFIKMYRDFSNTYVAYEHAGNNEITELNTLRYNFLSDSIQNYKEHLFKVLDEIEEEFSYEVSQDILKKNTREYQFNETLRMLNISKDDLIDILNFDAYTVEQWFSYEQANPLKQDKIRDLYDFLHKIQELFKGNYNLLDLLKYSFIDTSDLVFDEDDKDKSTILSYVLSSWHDKTTVELAYECVENYKRKNEWEGDIKLIKKLGEAS